MTTSSVQDEGRKVKYWSHAKLAKELSFAKSAVTQDDPATKDWLDLLEKERQRRFGS